MDGWTCRRCQGALSICVVHPNHHSARRRGRQAVRRPSQHGAPVDQTRTASYRWPPPY
jgi:hypothetical protein